jgi:hypothetical protein
MKKLMIWGLTILLSSFTSLAQRNEVIYVNANSGNDDAAGSQMAPLKSLFEAAKRVNKLAGKGSIQVLLSEGTYGLAETATFNPTQWVFSNQERLEIRAEILPDSSAWEPNKMPIIVSTMPFKLERDDKKVITGGSNYGILIESSHATIQGLRILGEPVHEKPKAGGTRSKLSNRMGRKKLE